MRKNTTNRMEHSEHHEMENTVKPARTLERTYWIDEGDAAVRWLIGKVNYGPYQEVRDELRKAQLEDVQNWAEQTNNLHLAQVCEQAIRGQESGLVKMNSDLGPTDRLVAVAASVLLYPAAKSMDVELCEVVDDQAVFSVDFDDQSIQVVVHPTATVASHPSTGAQEAWRTSDGSESFDVLASMFKAE